LTNFQLPNNQQQIIGTPLRLQETMRISVLFVVICLGLVFCNAYPQASPALLVPQSEPADPLHLHQDEALDQTSPEIELQSSGQRVGEKDFQTLSYEPSIEQRQAPKTEEEIPDYGDLMTHADPYWEYYEVFEDVIRDGNYIDPISNIPFPPIHGVFPRTFLDVNCGEEKDETLRGAWGTAKKMAEAQTTTVSGFEYDTIHKTWLGDDYAAEGTPLIDFRSKAIALNFLKM
jgi:hypothetical protein